MAAPMPVKKEEPISLRRGERGTANRVSTVYASLCDEGRGLYWLLFEDVGRFAARMVRRG